jgi:proline dehydrogenase
MFSLLARSATLKRLASQYGMTPNGFARRFIAGETVHEAIDAARTLHGRGLLVALDYLGESVSTSKAASAATREYAQLIETIVASGIERNISLKLTQLGLTIDRATCVDNLRRILEPARQHEFFVRIDMESSQYTQLTIDVFETLWRLDFRNIGIALQSSLHRTEQDVRRMNELGARVRLVKGAYKEPASVAFQQKADVDAAYMRQMRLLLDHGSTPPNDTSAATSTNSRCCTASGGICRAHSSPPATACACISRSARSGFRISCGGWASGRPMWDSCSRPCWGKGRDNRHLGFVS